jgi:hypothetical protein
MFSAKAIFIVKAACVFGEALGIALSEWTLLSIKAEREKAKAVDLTGLVEPARISSEGNWAWAVTRAVENGRTFSVYAYATFAKGQWLLDMHVGEEYKPPHFGLEKLRSELERPFVFIPMSSIFKDVYIECKKLLGVETAAMKD